MGPSLLINSTACLHVLYLIKWSVSVHYGLHGLRLIVTHSTRSCNNSPKWCPIWLEKRTTACTSSLYCCWMCTSSQSVLLALWRHIISPWEFIQFTLNLESNTLWIWFFISLFEFKGFWICIYLFIYLFSLLFLAMENITRLGSSSISDGSSWVWNIFIWQNEM